MDDMKRLIEKYKQELMEYSKASAPKEKLAFPEMIEENNAVQTMQAPDEHDVPAAVREPDAPPVSSAAEGEEMLDCRGEPVTMPQQPPQPPAEPEPSDEPERDCEELTPVTFSGNMVSASGAEPQDPRVSETRGNTAELPPAQAAGQPAPARKPEIIGYVDDEGSFDYESIFGDMLSEPRVSDRRVAAADAIRRDELPSQQEKSETNTAVSVVRGGDLEFAGDISGVTDNSPSEPRPESVPSGSVTPKQAEQLTDRPINSRPSEQLTGRSFENGEAAANSRSDIQPLHGGTAPADLPPGSPAYSNLQDFVPSEGYEDNGDGQYTNNFRFQVYTAREALPIAGAHCVIKRKENGGYKILHKLVTDISGQTTPVALAAPPASLSQSPGNTVQPYALYDAEVSAKGYNTVEIRNIPVFEGVLSVQRVAMIPLTEESVTEIIDEQETSMNGGK